MPKKKSRKKALGAVKPEGGASAADREDEAKPMAMTTIFTKPNGQQLSVVHDAPLETRTERRARERREAKQLAAEKRRKARSTTALCDAVLRGGPDTPEAILQAGAALAATSGTSSSTKSSKPKKPDIPTPRQAAHRHPDLSQFTHPEVAECAVGDGTADSRTWDGTTDEKRARAIVRSRMSFAPPVPGIYDHATWATKSGPRLRELLRLMQGEPYREGIVSGSQQRTSAKDTTSRCLICSRLKKMGGVSNVDPEDMESIRKLTEGVWIEEPDFEGNWDLVHLNPGRVQAALELYANERAMDLLMSWLMEPVTSDEIELVNQMDSTAGGEDNQEDVPQELILRVRVHKLGAFDCVHPNDEQLIREILVGFPIHLRFVQAAMEKRNRDLALVTDETKRIEPTEHANTYVPRVFKQRYLQAMDKDDPYWYGDSPADGTSIQIRSDGADSLEGPLAKPENKYMSIADLPGATAVEKLDFHNRNNARTCVRRRNTFGLDVLESTGRDHVLEVLHALQPPELMEDLRHLSRNHLRKILRPHELAIHLHKPSSQCLELRKSVQGKSFLAGIHPKDTKTLRTLAEKQFWPVELLRAGFVYQLCSLCERQSGESSYSRECAVQMARINALLASDPDDTYETNRMREGYAQATLDKLMMCEQRDGGADAPWPYELQPLLRLPGFSEELGKACGGVHSLQEWGAKILNPVYAFPMINVVEDLPEKTRDQVVMKNRYRYALNELVSLLRNDHIYDDEFQDAIAELADKRRGTRPTLSDPIDIGGTQIMIRQTNAYADRVYGSQLGDDWLDSADSYFNSDRLNTWTPGMVSAWMQKIAIQGSEATILWVMRAQLDGGLSGLHAQLLKPEGPPCDIEKDVAAELIEHLEDVQRHAAQLDMLWKDRAKTFAAELADHTLEHIPQPSKSSEEALQDKWSEQERRQVLQKLKKSELRKLATKLGVDEDQLDDAYDAPDIQAALIDLVVNREAKYREASDFVDKLAMDMEHKSNGVRSKSVTDVPEISLKGTETMAANPNKMTPTSELSSEVCKQKPLAGTEQEDPVPELDSGSEAGHLRGAETTTARDVELDNLTSEKGVVEALRRAGVSESLVAEVAFKASKARLA